MGGGAGHGEASPGAVIGDRYVLEELVGRGGMADVYRARDRRLDRSVAIKVFRPGSDPDGARRLVAEARLLAPLDHPGVVAMSDGGVDESRPFLVMPLVTGGTLADRLVSGPLPVPEVARLGRELASTLAYLHERRIVHRDVKPSNVLLDADGRPLLGDFGVSRFVDSTRQTSTGQIVGTAAYLAPEQVRGSETGPPADVYALGLVLLECLTGNPVYAGTNQISVATTRLHREAELPEDLPDELRAVLAPMVATDADRRPDAAACARRLGAVADAPRDAVATVALPVPGPVPPGSGAPAGTRPPGWLRGLAAAVVRGSRRPAVAVGGLALAAVAVVAGVLPFTFGAGQPPAEHIVTSGGPTASADPSATSPSPTASPSPSHEPSTPTPVRSLAVTHEKRPPAHDRHRGHGHDKPHGKHGPGGGHGDGH